MSNINMIASDNHPNMQRLITMEALHVAFTEEKEHTEPILAVNDFNAVQFADGKVIRCVSASPDGYLFLDGDFIESDVLLDFLSDGHFILAKI